MRRGPDITPSDEHAALVGHIVMDWAIVDYTMGLLATRLAFAPDYPARSITDRVSGRGRDAAVKSLLDLHSIRYNRAIVTAETDTRFRVALKQVKELRDRRNEFAHAISMRVFEDELSMGEHRGWSGRAPIPDRTTADLQALRDQIFALTAELESLLEEIPQASEGALIDMLAPGWRGQE